jgi:sec-independent protein translocase protein TatA
MFHQLGPTEIFVVLGVVLLLFGGKKLPELARGSGRALRIFKTEIKELENDIDVVDDVSPAPLGVVKSTDAGRKAEQG